MKKVVLVNKKKTLCILFSESNIGIHRLKDTDTEEFRVLVLTFPSKVAKQENKIVFSTNLHKNHVVTEAVSLYLKERASREVFILVGYDSDENGEVMSSALRGNLMALGVDPAIIVRTPLTFERYIVLRRFAETGLYRLFLNFQQEFSSILRLNNIRKNVGFAKSISLMHIFENRGKRFAIDENDGVNLVGSSTATLITKEITGEE